MSNGSNVEQLTSTLQAKWYNTLSAGLGADPEHFQLLQPSVPLGNTSDKLWEYFNNLPPDSLSFNFQASGGNRFYDDYEAVVAQLVSQGYDTLKRDLGDDYDDWMDYLKNLNPMPDTKEIPEKFRSWAMIYAPEKASVGYNDYQSILLDPIALAKDAVMNTTGFKNGVPNFSQTMDDLRSLLTQAAAYTIDFDSSTASSDTSNTWAKGSLGGFFDIFSGSASGSYSKLTQKVAESSIKITAEFKHVTTCVASPGSWYNSSAIGTAYSNDDNTVWAHGSPSWNSTFGDNGNMRFFAASLIVADGIDITISSDASYGSDEQQDISAKAKAGIWPFFSISADGGSSTDVSFKENGAMSVSISSPAGNPVILGANVYAVDEYLHHSGPNQVKLSSETCCCANATVSSVNATIKTVTGTHSFHRAGQANGYLLNVSNTSGKTAKFKITINGNAPVTYTLNNAQGRDFDIAEGQDVRVDLVSGNRVSVWYR